MDEKEILAKLKKLELDLDTEWLVFSKASEEIYNEMDFLEAELKKLGDKRPQIGYTII